ncbi:MAG TPA: hypothetical protein VLX31_17555 [Streptosporangiaceae bacterium]|nr:hypothetical protein [Streptosporangiaceae bacterium]
MPRYARALLVVVAVVATAFGAAACGPSHPHPKKSSLGPAGY